MKPTNPWNAKTKSFASREEWVEGRCNSIGASEVATILGVGYASQSPYSLWAEKSVGAERAKFSAKMLRKLEIGTIIEPALRDIFKLVSGLECWAPEPNTMMVHSEFDFLTATLDGICLDSEPDIGYCPVELKNIAQHNLYEWRDGNVPLKYQIQLQQQMLVTGAKRGYLFGLVGGNDPHYYPIDRNEAYLESVIPQLREFWQQVRDKNPPPVDGSEATYESLNSIREQQTIAILPADLEEVADKFEKVKEQKKELDKEEKLYGNQLRAAIGNNAMGVFPSGTQYTYKSQDRAGYIVEPNTIRVLRRVNKK